MQLSIKYILSYRIIPSLCPASTTILLTYGKYASLLPKVHKTHDVAHVAVARRLPVWAILGRDVPDVLQLLKWNAEVVLATTTQVQARAEAQVKARVEEQEQCSGAVPNPIDADELQGTTVIISRRPLTDTTPLEEAVWGREFDDQPTEWNSLRNRGGRSARLHGKREPSLTHQHLRSHSGHVRSSRDGRRKMSPWNWCEGKWEIKTPY